MKYEVYKIIKRFKKKKEEKMRIIKVGGQIAINLKEGKNKKNVFSFSNCY